MIDYRRAGKGLVGPSTCYFFKKTNGGGNVVEESLFN